MSAVYAILLGTTVTTASPLIPTIEIAAGVHMPMVGLGTWLYNTSTTEAATKLALDLGYTHIDTAWDYHNSDGVGRALKASGRARSSVFITTKVEGGLNRSRTFAEVEEDLKNLSVPFVDLILVHFPAPVGPAGWLPGGKAVRQEQWKALEDVVRAGKARAIGVSHFCERHLLDILEIATIKPAINQVEFHIGMGSAGINATDVSKAFCKKYGITFQSFSPLCGPCGTDELISGKLVTSIGKKYGKSGAQVALRWQVQQGIPVIPKTYKKKFMLENIDLFSWSLSEADMVTLTAATSPAVAGGGDGKVSGDCVAP